MYTIAELADNHADNESVVERTIAFVKHVGFSAIKFQAYEMDDFIQNRTPTTFGIDSRDYFERYRMKPALLKKAVDVCQAEKVPWGVSPTLSRLQECMALGPNFIKVGSDMMLDEPFLQALSRCPVDVVASTGMLLEDELRRAMDILMDGQCRVRAILHCTSQYPTLPAHAHLGRIHAMRRAYPAIPIGYSHHGAWEDTTFSMVRLAIAAGAVVIEQHVALSREFAAIGDRVAIDRYGMVKFAAAVHETMNRMGEETLGHSSEEMRSRQKWLA
jgi:sialic acid synthase SpsE